MCGVSLHPRKGCPARRVGHLGGYGCMPPKDILKYYVSIGAFRDHLALNLLVSHNRKMYFLYDFFLLIEWLPISEKKT